MLIVTSILACVFLLPTELEHFAASLVAATGSVSNIYFWNQSGYFDAPATTKVLLHTWSLAVEEQFYIIFPILLVVIRRLFKERPRFSIVVLTIISFVISAFGAYRFPSTTFYMPYTRAWELLLGTILSLQLLPKVRGVLGRNLVGIAGLALILFAGLKYSSITPFPGIAALAPCLGATMIIAAGESGSSLVGQALSLRPMVFVGLISYSLYLWHWPIIVFQRVGSVLMKGGSDATVKLVALAASLVIGTLSWKYVELPFRHGRLKLKGKTLFGLAAVAAMVPFTLGAAMLALHGLPSRYPAEAVRVAAYLDNHSEQAYRSGTCFIANSYTFKDFDQATCLHQETGKPNVLLVGDSHAAMLWYGLSNTFTDVNLMQATASGCKPTLEPARGDESRCRNLIDFIFHDYVASHHVDTILLSARWVDADIPRLTRTITFLKQRGLKVVVFGPIVQYDAALPRLLAASLKENNPGLPNHHRVKSYERLDTKMDVLAREQWKVPYISFFKLLCTPSSCVEYANSGAPIQADYDHLTQDGSLLIAQKLNKSGGLP
jgi:peptidoglycan/LPS O-acetylase OafA/YrhL